ncbi:MAG: retroviral-like aspartic protease family protein [Thermoplasmata archaeon]|nr:retroviral-like aspartic protease family protein [Thermoplasmata archaeon]
MTIYRFEKEAPVIVVDVTLHGDGKKKLEMALDTGATYMMIPWEIADVLGYRPELSKERITLITPSGIEKVPLITVKSVSVLGKSANNINAVVHDLPQKSYVDGLLGLSFLKNFRLNIDFRGGTLDLE